MTDFVPDYNDPLVIDEGFPLDNSGDFLARDYIAPVVVPYPLEGPGATTEYIPTTPGIMRRGGPSPVSQYPGIPGFLGRLDTTTGLVSEFYTGTVYTWFQWEMYKYNTTYERFRYLMETRDVSNDLINLPGKKPYFHDDWYGYVPDKRRGDPRIWF